MTGKFNILGNIPFMQKAAARKAAEAASAAPTGDGRSTSTAAQQKEPADSNAPDIKLNSTAEPDGPQNNSAAMPAAGAPAADTKPVLSGKLRAMNFMKRSGKKRGREEDAEEQQQQQDKASKTTSSSTPNSKRRLVIIQESDPLPVGCFGRMSFGGFNPATEALQAAAKGLPPPAKAAPPKAAAAAEEGVDVDSKTMAARIGGTVKGWMHPGGLRFQKQNKKEQKRWK